MRQSLDMRRSPIGLPDQRSAAPKSQTRRQLSELRTALADGWEIVQPIFARPQWTSLDDRHFAFHFVLQRDRATRLVTVPETRTSARFIRDRDLEINEIPVS